MTLEEIYFIGQTVAVIAVIASLIFVGLQIRQNTKAQNLASQQGFYALKNAFVTQIAEDPVYANIYRRGLEDISQLSQTEQWQFGAMMQLSFDTALMAFRDPAAFEDGHAEAWFITLRPGSIAWWQKGKTLYPREFRDWIDGEIERLESR